MLPHKAITCAFCFVVLNCFCFSVAAQQKVLGCGPEEQKFHVTVHKDKHPTPDPSRGKAIVYVIHRKKWPDSTGMGQSGKTMLAVNGNWVGGNLLDTYFYFEADPGLLRVCSAGMFGAKGKNAFMALTVEAGKSYYLRQLVAFSDTEIVQLPEEEAKKLLSKCKFATLEAK